MSEPAPKHRMRDRRNGRYLFDGDMTRLCKCGHTLGVHCAGGHDCFNGDPKVPGADGKACDCQKFRLARAR